MFKKKSFKKVYWNSKNWLFKMSYFIKNVWNWKMSEIEIKYISSHFEITIFWECVSTLASSTNLLEKKKRKISVIFLVINKNRKWGVMDN